MVNQNLEDTLDRIRRETPSVYDLLISRYEILFDVLHAKRTQRNIKFRKQLWKFINTLVCSTWKLIVGETRWEKVAFIILFILLLVGRGFSYYNIFINEPNKAWYVLIWLVAWTSLWLFKLCRGFKRKTQRDNKSELVHRFLKRNKRKAKIDLVVIHELCSVAHISTLDFVLAEIKELIDERQAQDEVYISSLPILSLFSVLLVFPVLGDFIKAFGGTLFFGAVVGVPGFILLVNQTNNFTTKWGIQRGIIFALKRSAFLLEQAKSILENIKE
ncbi:hypothetical protein [Chroococcidiopsis sp.]|uniref:hypothetical protein n=1 Tax=Chroococcidiopsis sp. TaxID=3088168 RepID=UPI003F330C8E